MMQQKWTRTDDEGIDMPVKARDEPGTFSQQQTLRVTYHGQPWEWQGIVNFSPIGGQQSQQSLSGSGTFRALGIPPIPPVPVPVPGPVPFPGPVPVPGPVPIPGPLPINRVNVRDYGAKGDGTTDDRAAIQSAVAKVPANGTLYLPAGRYVVREPVVIGRTMTVSGDGPASVLVHGLANGLSLAGDYPNPVVMKMSFEGAPGRYTDNRVNAISVFGPHDALITDCTFRGPGYAVYSEGVVGTTRNTRIENCVVNGWGRVAIFCNGGEVIKNCQLIQDDPALTAENSSHGIYIHSQASGVLVEDVLIRNARKYAAQVYGQDLNTFTRNTTFRRVRVENCANGITLQGGAPDSAVPDGVLIEGCQITGTYNGAALEIKTGQNIIIQDNVIDGCGSAGLQLGVWAPWQPGFRIKNLTACRNKITRCDRGVWALASSGGTFENVRVTQSGWITGNRRDVDLEGNPAGVTVTA